MPVIRTHFKSAVQHGIRTLHAALLNRGLPSRIAVCLHSIEPPFYPAFREMVSFFRGEGYRIVDPDRFLGSTREGDKMLFISFDDNYRSWYEARALFENLGVQATFYTNTCAFRDRAGPEAICSYFDRLGYRGPRVPLATPELRALDADGHTVGAHTHSHLKLNTLSLQEAKQEIGRCRATLACLLGKPIRHFSYPYGMRRYFPEDLRVYCREIGFTTIANAVPGLQHAPQDAFDLNRSVWDLRQPLWYNLQNLCIDGRLFEMLSGRSAVG